MKQACLQDQKPDMIAKDVCNTKSGRYICISGGWTKSEHSISRKRKKETCPDDQRKLDIQGAQMWT